MRKALSRNKYLIFEFVKKNVKSQYRNSFLGMVWSVLTPLLNSLIMYVVFKELFKNNDNFYILYLLCGNILFQALRSGTTSALTSIVSNRGLLLKVKIDEEVFPMSSVLTSVVNFGFSMIALFIAMILFQIKYNTVVFGYQLIFVLLMLPAFLLFTFGIGLALSALYVFFRDLQHLYGVFLTLWTYLTPIFYNVSRYGKESFALKIIKLNPMYHFIDYFRDCVYVLPSAGSLASPSFSVLINLYLIGVISVAIGFIFFKSTKKNFMNYI